MKVLFLSGSNSRNSGGLYNSVRNLGQSLLKLSSVEPVLLAHNDEYSDLDLAAYAPMKVEDYHLIGPRNVGYSNNIEKKIAEIKPDILHPQCVWMYLSYINLKYHKKTDSPYLISPRGMLDEWIINNGRLKKEVAGFLYEKENLKHAACLHALCLPEYEAIRKYGCKNPVAIIPNGVNLPDSDKPNFEMPLWKKNDSRKNLLFLSRLHPKKGIENLLQAWSLAGYKKKEWKLIIAGESSDKSYLDKLNILKTKLGLDENVFFIGPQFHKDKDNCFKSADAFILPSFSEGLPMAVLEAWSYKLPVIITEACNLPEGFEAGAAIKANPEPESILSALTLLFEMSEKERTSIGMNGYDLVVKKFTWSSIALQMQEVYDWVLNNGKIPSCIKFN